MSQSSLDAWRASIDELRAGTSELEKEAWLARMSEFWDPEIEFDISDAPAGLSGIYLGRDVLLALWREWFGAWEGLESDYELVDAGEQVVLLVEWRPRAPSGERVVSRKNAWVSTFRDGLMIRSKFYVSHSAALEAAGISA